MKIDDRKIVPVFCFSAIVLLTVMVLILALSGCAVGLTKDAYGAEQAVVGFSVGEVNRVAEQVAPVAVAAAKTAFPWLEVATLATGALGIGAGAHYRSKRNSEQETWDEAWAAAKGTPATPPQ